MHCIDLFAAYLTTALALGCMFMMVIGGLDIIYILSNFGTSIVLARQNQIKLN